MDYEKKYNEALAWMRELYPGLHGATKYDAEHFFPELRESEDERIRKTLIDMVKRETGFTGFPSQGQVLAWLEKQKEPKHVDDDNPLNDPRFIDGFDTGREVQKIFDEPAEWSEEEQQKEQKPVESISQLTVQGKGVYKICPRCKERMVRDDSKVYTSMPPQYGYVCPKCGEMEFDTVMYDNPEMVVQKPAWSEEDEDRIRQIERIAQQAGCTQKLQEEIHNWLKSIRPQPKQEWSKEDENKLYQVMGTLLADKTVALRDTPHCKALHEAYDEMLAWLKSLPLRCPKSSDNWKPSEEDERILKGIIGKINHDQTYGVSKDEMLNFLKRRTRNG